MAVTELFLKTPILKRNSTNFCPPPVSRRVAIEGKNPTTLKRVRFWFRLRAASRHGGGVRIAGPHFTGGRRCYSPSVLSSLASHLPLDPSASLLHPRPPHSAANYRREFQVGHASSGNTHIQCSIYTHTQRRRHTHTPHDICSNPQTVVTVGEKLVKTPLVFHAYVIP